VLLEVGVSLDDEDFFLWCIFLPLEPAPAAVELWPMESFDMLEPLDMEPCEPAAEPCEPDMEPCEPVAEPCEPDVEPCEPDVEPCELDEPVVPPLVGGVDCCAMAMPVAVRPQSISERQILVRMCLTLDISADGWQGCVGASAHRPVAPITQSWP
jgi:hypothetical protein